MRKTAFFLAPALLAAAALAGCDDEADDRRGATVSTGTYESRDDARVAGDGNAPGAAPDRSDATASPAHASAAPACSDCATVTHIQRAEDRGEASGAGAVAGAIVGGVIGHQFGSGRGQDAATVAGAAAGGYAGNEIEKERGTRVFYRVTLAMDNGSVRELNVGDPAGLSVGSKVRVVGNDLELA